MAHLQRAAAKLSRATPMSPGSSPSPICGPVKAAVAHGGHAQLHSKQTYHVSDSIPGRLECRYAALNRLRPTPAGFANHRTCAQVSKPHARCCSGRVGDMQRAGGERPGGRASQYRLRCATATSARMRSSRCTCSCARRPAPPAANPPRGDTAAGALPDAALQARGHGPASGSAHGPAAACSCLLR